MKTEYVLGFMLSDGSGEDSNGQFALIWKQRPKWQANHLNGIGGHIEKGESPLAAMTREFKEETGYEQKEWKQFAQMEGVDWIVYCFVSEGPLNKLKSITDERIDFYRIEDVDGTFLENVAMLMQMAWFSFFTKDSVSIKIDYH